MYEKQVDRRYEGFSEREAELREEQEFDEIIRGGATDAAIFRFYRSKQSYLTENQLKLMPNVNPKKMPSNTRLYYSRSKKLRDWMAQLNLLKKACYDQYQKSKTSIDRMIICANERYNEYVSLSWMNPSAKRSVDHQLKMLQKHVTDINLYWSSIDDLCMGATLDKDHTIAELDGIEFSASKVYEAVMTYMSSLIAQHNQYYIEESVDRAKEYTDMVKNLAADTETFVQFYKGMKDVFDHRIDRYERIYTLDLLDFDTSITTPEMARRIYQSLYFIDLNVNLSRNFISCTIKVGNDNDGFSVSPTSADFGKILAKIFLRIRGTKAGKIRIICNRDEYYNRAQMSSADRLVKGYSTITNAIKAASTLCSVILKRGALVAFPEIRNVINNVMYSANNLLESYNKLVKVFAALSEPSTDLVTAIRYNYNTVVFSCTKDSILYDFLHNTAPQYEALYREYVKNVTNNTWDQDAMFKMAEFYGVMYTSKYRKFNLRFRNEPWQFNLICMFAVWADNNVDIIVNINDEPPVVYNGKKLYSPYIISQYQRVTNNVTFDMIVTLMGPLSEQKHITMMELFKK